MRIIVKLADLAAKGFTIGKPHPHVASLYHKDVRVILGSYTETEFIMDAPPILAQLLTTSLQRYEVPFVVGGDNEAPAGSEY